VACDDRDERTGDGLLWTPGLRRQLALLAVACSMEAFCYTICVPFLTPYLRAKHGTTVTASSAVFVAYTLGSVFVTPLVTYAIRACGCCSRAIVISLLVLGLAESSSVVACDLSTLFAARFVAGMAGGMVWSSVLSACSILSKSSSKKMATMFGVILSAVSLGTMSGPAVGGVLFAHGGFSAPFVAMGVLCLLIALLAHLLLDPLPLPPAEPRRATSEAGPCSTHAPALVLLSVAVGALVFSSIDGVLPVHIEDVLIARGHVQGSVTMDVSLVFLLISLCYGACAPLVGGLAHSHSAALYVSTAGSLVLASLLPAFALATQPWQYYTVAVFYGAAGSAQLTPASALLERAVSQTKSAPRPILLYACFNCSYVSGMALGPSIFAFLVDEIGFRKASLALSGSSALTAIVVALALSRELDLRPGQGLRGEREDALEESLLAKDVAVALVGVPLRVAGRNPSAETAVQASTRPAKGSERQRVS